MMARRGDRTRVEETAPGEESARALARAEALDREIRARLLGKVEAPGWKPAPKSSVEPIKAIDGTPRSDEPILLDALPHPASLDGAALMQQCVMTRSRGTGPGGQHRNKVETEVRLTHTPTGLMTHAGERRSAEQNRAVALTRMRLELATRVRCPVPVGDARSALWLKRCAARGKAAGRVSCNPSHADYPAMLALALDVVHVCGWDMRRAALRLVCTPTQLLKLIKDHPPALVWLNVQRKAHALRPLK